MINRVVQIIHLLARYIRFFGRSHWSACSVPFVGWHLSIFYQLIFYQISTPPITVSKPSAPLHELHLSTSHRTNDRRLVEDFDGRK